MVLTDVPDDEVEAVVVDFGSEVATVMKEQQADGKWTVRASFSSGEADR